MFDHALELVSLALHDKKGGDAEYAKRLAKVQPFRRYLVQRI